MLFVDIIISLAILCSICSGLKITIFQPKMKTLTPNRGHQLNALESAVQEAASSGSKILMMPELYLSGYGDNLFEPGVAIKVGGGTYKKVVAMAVQYNISILFTFPEQDPNNSNVYDSACLIYRNGTTLINYRKVNLAAGEDQVFTPGSAFAPVIDFEGVRLGVLICFDIFLPEPARTLALESAQVILVPTANGYPPGINAISDTIVPARALENNAFVAYNNWVQNVTGSPPYFQFFGETVVCCDANGGPIYKAPSTESALRTVYLNTTGWTGNTAIGRPAPNYQDGLCNNVTTPIYAR